MPPAVGPLDKVKLWVWRRFVYPAFPLVRDGLLSLGVIRHTGRQPWHIGWLDPQRKIEDFLAHLQDAGFNNHFVAWMDTGQVLSVRRHDGFAYQYHLRVFADGEVRGHYEKTPESNPVEHFTEKVFEARTEDFLEWIGDWVVPQPPAAALSLPSLVPLLVGKTRSHNMPATSRAVPEKG